MKIIVIILLVIMITKSFFHVKATMLKENQDNVIKIILQNVEATLDFSVLLDNILSMQNNIIIFQGMKPKFIQDLKANNEYKNIYNIYQVGQIAILNHKETIICEKTVAYQTLQKYDPNQQQDNKIETLLSTSCQPLDVVNINRVHKKINIFTFNSQPYNITKAYCKLFRGLLNKENIIVAGNVRNNIQLQNECFRDKLHLFDAWELMKDSEGNTFDIENNDVAKYVDDQNSDYNYNKRRDRIYIKNWNYNIFYIEIFSGKRRRKFIKNVKYYQSADYGLLISIGGLRKNIKTQNLKSFCQVQKEITNAQKELLWLEEFIINNTTFFYDNDDDNKFKKQLPALKSSFNLIKQFKSLSFNLIKHMQKYIQYFSTKNKKEDITREMLHNRKIISRNPSLQLHDPTSLEAIFDNNNNNNQNNDVKTSNRDVHDKINTNRNNDNDENNDGSMKKLKMKDPTNLNALFNDDDNQDIPTDSSKNDVKKDKQSQRSTINVGSTNTIVDKSDNDDPLMDKTLKTLQKLRHKILLKRNKKKLFDNQYNPLKVNWNKKRDDEALKALIRV